MASATLSRRNSAHPIAILLLLICGGFSLTSTGCVTGPQYARPAVFQSYPADPALDSIIDVHVGAGRDPREARLLLTTWFLDGTPRGASEICSVRPDGRTTTYQFVHDVGFNKPRSSNIPPETLSLIQNALATLPPTQHPTLANMLIVSYWLDGRWQTRLYDRTKRPPGMSTVFELTGAPILPSP